MVGSVLWLLPDKTTSEDLAGLISSFSSKYETPVFDPHITLAGVPKNSGNEVLSLIKSISRENSEFTVSLGKVVCGDRPYQKLMVNIEPSPAFLYFCKRADDIFDGDYSKKENPHFSLLYGDISCKDLVSEKEFAQIKLPERVLISAIALVELNGTPENWKIKYAKNMA